jgi:hypothetical protein
VCFLNIFLLFRSLLLFINLILLLSSSSSSSSSSTSRRNKSMPYLTDIKSWFLEDSLFLADVRVFISTCRGTIRCEKIITNYLVNSLIAILVI